MATLQDSGDHETLEADDHDRDSTFGGDRDSLASSSTSLLSGITKYQFENGRRYHAYQAGKYHFPNDEQELNRMDIEHHNQLLQLDGRLHLCPIEEPQEVLDLGTGTGIWVIDMADKYPSAQVIGTDLSPVQPSWVPPNCSFQVDDFDQEWTFGENRFDLIHVRFLMGSIGDHLAFYEKVLHALKPGGYIEVCEMECGNYSDDGTVKADSAVVRWWAELEEAFKRIGKPILKCHQHPEILKQAGFTDVYYEIKQRPNNDWPRDARMKEIGRFSCLNYLEGLEGFTVAPFTRVLGWSRPEVDILLAQVRAEMVKRSVHGWQKGIICYARKPFDAQP